MPEKTQPQSHAHLYCWLLSSARIVVEYFCDSVRKGDLADPRFIQHIGLSTRLVMIYQISDNLPDADNLPDVQKRDNLPDK